MQCEKCKAVINEGEEQDYHGQLFCEDCYFDLLSPVKACDPWAVHSAKTFLNQQGDKSQINPLQEKILDFLREKGPTEQNIISSHLQVKSTDIEREIASLRHMEKICGELINGKKVVKIWDKK
ncbi:MAG: hypothetical protein HQK75_08950 [Candidatus Magnetomorum sp.]|uniref:LIM zinc-binding protein n=1 Tax=Candidatus Magnetoglobus multicellularis str. Araruama TaxID=890399 RepID=A0A1V1PDW6_9BACT|nr:MAG: LIM zinc-binding protein [Candidatus Magnetoglobus multicellularis str. Araruama]MBF0450815.1 hypothetical protein [Candidatus Magnetomorum sp.]